MELRLLVLPACAEVAFKVRIFFQLGIAVGGEHLAVGVDVYALALGLLQKQLHIVEIVTADNDKGAFFNSQRNFRGHRLTVGFGVGSVKHFHALEIYLTRFEHQIQQIIGGFVLAQSIESLVQKIGDSPVRLSQRIGMICVCRHTLYSEKDKGFKGAYVLVCVPYHIHVIVLELFGVHTALFLFYLSFHLLDGNIVEINVGDSGEKPFENKNICLFGGIARL